LKGESENANSNAKQLSTLLVANDGQYVKEHYEQVNDPLLPTDINPYTSQAIQVPVVSRIKPIIQ
jgi:hypothetical protein